MGARENNLQKLLSKEERSWPRLKCNYFTECSDVHGNRWPCKIVDISHRGLGIVLSAALRKGETLSIVDPHTKAIAVWIENGRAGLRVCN